MIFIVSASLRAESVSRRLASAAEAYLRSQGHAVELLDLREHALPLCDGGAAYSDPQVLHVTAKLEQADGILVATPIYNYDATAALKNLIELTGEAWEGKVVGFLCAAGGASSYMSIMALANSLMLDFRSLIVPRFVYATADCLDEANEPKGDILARVQQLATETARLATAVRSVAA